MIWLPGVLSLGMGFLAILCSLATPFYFVDHACDVYESAKSILSNGLFLCAATFVLVPDLLFDLATHLESLTGMTRARRIFWPTLASVGASMWVAFVKYCQYRGFQLDVMDTTAMTQMAYNTLHGRWLESTVFGCNILSIHFAFTIALLSPILLLWKSAMALLLVQSAGIGSLGLACYLITYSLTSSSLAGFIAMALCYSNPFFQGLIAGQLENSIFMAVFFLWATVFFVRQRWLSFAILLLLAVTGREQLPFTLAGFAMYWTVKDGIPSPIRCVKGIGVVCAATLLWAAEMKVIAAFPNGLAAGYWNMYSKFGSTRTEIIRYAFSHPMAMAAEVFVPPVKSWDLFKPLLFSALTPFAAPAALIPYFLASIPQQLVALSPGKVPDWQISSYQHYLLHYSAPIFGPLLFAMSLGVARLYERNGHAGRRRAYFLIPVIVTCGLGVRSAPPILRKNWGLDMFYSAPAVIEQVPDDASLWSDSLTGPWVACRSRLKIIPLKLGPELAPPSWFANMLFRPEYVLLSKGRLRLGGVPSYVLQFLAENRYEKIVDHVPTGVELTDPQSSNPADQRADFILLKDPTISRTDGASTSLLLPTTTDPKLTSNYIQYLLATR